MQPQFKLRLLHEITDVYDDNIDAVVDFDDRKSFGITFFTKKNISTLCERRKKDAEIYEGPGERLNGAYFWAIDCVIVEKLEYSFLEQVVADMLYWDEHIFEKHFTKMTTDDAFVLATSPNPKPTETPGENGRH